MEHEKSDRMVVDEMLARMPDADRAALDDADRAHRLGTTPMALFVNGGTGEMLSNQLDDDAVADMEQRYAAILRRRRLL